MFNFVKAIALLIFGAMSTVDKYSIPLFTAMFVLKNIGIYVSSLNNYNIVSYIKVSVN